MRRWWSNATPPEPVASQPETSAASKPSADDDASGEIAALVGPEQPKAAEAAYANIVINERRFRDAKPINFGKASPKQLAVHGVDISRWQGDIDWAKLRGQGANFVYIKSTDGGDHLDPMFRQNWRDAEKAGLKRGAYHFFYWCRTAREQADWFIRNVPKVKGALPPVIDVEWNHTSSCKRRPSRDNVIEKMQVFMDKLEAPLRPAADHLHRAGFLCRQSEGRVPGLSVLAALGGGASLKGLSGPQMGVLAIFGLRPVARRRGPHRPQRVQRRREPVAPLAGPRGGLTAPLTGQDQAPISHGRAGPL